MLPEIISVWKKVHVRIDLRDEKSLSAQINT